VRRLVWWLVRSLGRVLVGRQLRSLGQVRAPAASRAGRWAVRPPR